MLVWNLNFKEDVKCLNSNSEKCENCRQFCMNRLARWHHSLLPTHVLTGQRASNCVLSTRSGLPALASVPWPEVPLSRVLLGISNAYQFFYFLCPDLPPVAFLVLAICPALPCGIYIFYSTTCPFDSGFHTCSDPNIYSKFPQYQHKFSITAVTNSHNFSGLKQYKLISYSSGVQSPKWVSLG